MYFFEYERAIFRNSEAQEDIMKQSGKPQPLSNGEDGSLIIKRDQIYMLFHKMVEEGKGYCL